MSDSEEDWPEWNCFECHRVAVNSVCLDLQMLTKEHVILVDVNGEKWVQCMCNRRWKKSKDSCILNTLSVIVTEL